ncbi:MAG: two pore domain potassium channel family protein [Bacteroidia bacterium]|nr:two pore domain potassium channel family protein [Bacteroidia bacterium]
MYISYVGYKVKIRNHEFVTDDGKKYSNMAAISFFDANKKEKLYLQLGYIDTEEIYKLIDEGQPIEIDNCYVEGFSLSTYRKSRGFKNDSYVKVKSFSAKNSVFESIKCNDFSYGDFTDGELNLASSQFINGEVTFAYSKFGDFYADFSYCGFKNGNVDFQNTVFGEGELSFKNAAFLNGVKNFQYADFGKGKLVFTNTEFGDGDVIFVNTNFNDGDVSFKVASFGTGNVDFRFAHFGEGNVAFDRTEFGNGKVNFSKAEFEDGKINFNRSVFGDGDVTFEGAELKKGKCNFQSVEFGSGDKNFELMEFGVADVIFDKTKFGQGLVSFYNSKFHVLSLKSCILENYMNFRVARCSYLDLSGTVVRDIIDLKPYDFPVDIKIINITGLCLLGRIYLDWNANHVEQMIVSQKKTNNRDKSDQFRILKQNFNSSGNYDYEDEAYVLFKRFEQKADLEDALKRKPKSAPLHYMVFGLKWLLYDKMGCYATNPFRALLSAVITYIFFSLLHFIIPFFYWGTKCYNGIDPELSFFKRLGLTFYYSAITFFTAGYGDIFPLVGAGMVVASIELFFGIFMMSYFTVAFARKILR